MAIIQFKDVWEMYRIKFIIDKNVSWDNFWALKGVSFDLERGETLGIIGENGAGKSTILKLIAGMLKPDRGEIKIKDKVSGLLELGAGFQPELTGKENVYLNAGLFGLSQRQIDEKYEEIASFADIGKFIYAPVKCYSQGMFVRLAFAIAIHVGPDILLIDDTLSVGDEHFQRKCIKKIFELKEQNKTIVFVTHDMNMLRRLCKRALCLKEGRIVKDGLTDEVIPLYTQMAGTKEGIGILERKPLTLIFNNGRLFLNWQDKLLTSNSGGCAIFFIGNRWYSSLQADWEIRKESENKLLAIGKLYQLALIQIWRLELISDYEIRWDIDLELQEPVDIQEGCTNIMLVNEYAQWFSNLEKGVFPVIDDKNKNWQALLEGNILRKCIGVKATEKFGNKFPSLVFEQSNYFYQSQTQIFNTDYLSNCRVLQYKTLGLQNYSTTQANRLGYFSGRIIINMPDIDNYLTNIYEDSVLYNGKLRLTFDKGCAILYYDSINLTKPSHMNTSIYANKRWFFSNLAQWEVKKESKDKLVAKGRWQDFPIVQIWEIEMTSESSFLWKINIQVNEEIDLEEQHAWLMCSQDYKSWFCDYGKGFFPDKFLELQLDMLQRCIPDGIIGLQSQNRQFPMLSFKIAKELKNFAKIFNSDFYAKSRILRVDRVEPEEAVRLSPGAYPCFAIEVVLDKDKQVHIEDSENMLKDERLRFFFDRGNGRIYWDGVELTKKLGLYTSLRSQGRWYDSASSAIWKTEEKNKDTIKVLGKWLHLPIVQYWEIRLREGNTIAFNVKMEVEREVEVDRLQTNLMLSESYHKWMAEAANGLFPIFKDYIDDDWESIWSGRADSKYIGVSESLTNDIHLPPVIFFPQELNAACLLNIINSDINHRSRILQYLNSNKMQISPGQYNYFSGKISIKS